jgi:two-component system phosphate regulon sensor histidine kinase PhoR
LDDIDAAVRRGQRAVAVAGLLGMLLALVVAYLASRILARPLVVLAERAGALAAGDFGQRAPLTAPVAELGDLYAAFNRLSEELQIRLSELRYERDEMKALIDTMAEGVVALDEGARVIRINRAARELLRVPDPVPLAPIGTLIHNRPLLEIFESSVVEGLEAQEVPLRDRTLMVSTRPLDEGGSVVTFLDVTESRKLERVRQDFVANASHELKTPLTTMRGFAETLIEDDPPEGLRKQFLAMIHSSSLRLQRVVDDLLDLSRLESGAWQARLQELDVGSAADAVWASLEHTAEGKEVLFLVEGYGSVRADPSALTQIFQNLFDNALRYVDHGGTIRVRIVTEGDTVTIDVEDDGAGIPASELPRIFERFYRVDAARSRAEGGTGLGLAIVRHLVTAMDGTVEAESEVGRGTTIRITLPSAR